MRSLKILEMLNAGQIEELKRMLRDDIYNEALKKSPGMKTRYAAMKKYFTYISTVREALQKPCMVEFEDKNYISFCNAHSLVLTTEPCGAMEMLADRDRYPDVTKLVNYDGEEREIDFSKVIAEAKSEGYSLKKSELGTKYHYLMRYDGAYFKLGLVDATYSIIDNGEKAVVYHKADTISPITIKNDIGICVIMPMRMDDDILDEFVVIDVE